MVGEIELISDCRLQISSADSFFPGTCDRIVLMGGSLPALQKCISLILKLISDSLFSTRHDSNRSMIAKLAVPNSAVSNVIGRRGSTVQRLCSVTDCTINVSPRIDDMKERLVTFLGSCEHLEVAMMEVCKLIQQDKNMKEHFHREYDVDHVKVPLGAWSGTKAQPIDPDAPLIHPSDALAYSKRELIEYLRAVAPREVLMRYRLLGDMRNVVKSISALTDNSKRLRLIDAMEETWRLRDGDHAPAECIVPPRHASFSGTSSPSSSEAMIRLAAVCADDDSSPSSVAGSRRYCASHQSPFKPRILSAMQLLTEDDGTDVESVFCGPPSEPGESGEWLENSVEALGPNTASG
eukprot:gnl/TRDRNA2_/TRDRNA2_136923_c1_seq1.p1 gnl/TRDRNA2_/TRDRNA2_136923_c1~~gnl/TRDRNA2_/TRDRNA2_136923_c1_seq1.p1  ORF type:complete len:398 (-),score=66.51 gnl/TRDRNA2_/TRDRNA2_136923_c1_seq1:32-1084(-)